jgi:hypothetical protein
MFQRFIDFFTGLTPDYTHPERVIENPLYLAEQSLNNSIHDSSMSFESISTPSMDTSMSYFDHNASMFD